MKTGPLTITISAQSGVFGKTLMQGALSAFLKREGHTVMLLDEGEKPRYTRTYHGAPIMRPIEVTIDTRTEETAAAPTTESGTVVRVNGDTPKPTKSDDGQVGGDHYKRLGVTPWHLIKCLESTGIPFVDYVRGDIIAYVARLKDADKDRPGMLAKLREDLLKTAHYAKEAAEVIAEKLEHFEKDEEQHKQGQGRFCFTENGIGWEPSPHPLRFDGSNDHRYTASWAGYQLDLFDTKGDF